MTSRSDAAEKKRAISQRLSLTHTSVELYQAMPWVKETIKSLEGLLADGHGPRRPIVQLHSSDRASAMRAVVGRVSATAKSLGYRKLHLEASRFGDPNFAFTPQGFIKPLVEALLTEERRRDYSTPDRFAEVMERLRRKLSETACLIFVHGLHNAAGRIAPTVDFITGTSSAIDLIRSLAVPPMESLVSGSGPRTCGRSLWVTFSLHEIPELLPYSEPPRPVSLAGWEEALQHANPPMDWSQRVFQEGERRSEKQEVERQDCLSVETGEIERLYGTSAKLLPEGALPPSDLELLLAQTVDKWRSGKQGSRKYVINRELEQHKVRSVDDLMAIWVRSLVAYDLKGLWFLSMVAAAPEGLFLGTLKRLLDHASALIHHNRREGESPSKKALSRVLHDDTLKESFAACQALVDRMTPPLKPQPPEEPVAAHDFDSPELRDYLPLLMVGSEVVTEHLSARILRWEVGAIGDETRVGGRRVDEGKRQGDHRRRIRFVSPVLRDAFLRAFIALDAEEGAGSGAGRRLTFDGCARLIQLAVAAEAFSQGAALLLHSSPSEVQQLQRRRLHVQALHHAACAGDLTGLTLDTGVTPGRGILPFPESAERRRHVVYMVLYRQLIEDRGAWTLSRRHGRSELRVALLLQLLSWGELTLPYGVGPKQLLTVPMRDSAPEVWRQQLEALLQRARQGSRFEKMMLKNLTHASLDAEDMPLANALMDQRDPPPTGAGAPPPPDKKLEGPNSIHTLRLGALLIDLQLHVRDDSHEAIEPKLAFALHDHDGASITLKKCEAAIAQDSPRLCREVRAYAKRLAKTLVHDAEPAIDFAAENKELERLGLIPITQKQGPAGPTAELTTRVADWCVRWADRLANDADEISDRRSTKPQEDRAQRVAEQTSGLLLAFVAYWVADFLRARSGEQPDISGVNWGRLAPRYFRTGIRTSLKLARLLTERHGDKAKAITDWLLEFARSRVGILTRDYNALGRELFQCLLLQSAIARTHDRIHRHVNRNDARLVMNPLPFERSASSTERTEALVDAVDYICDAEARWLALGGPNALARRLVVERISLVQTIARTYLGTLSGVNTHSARLDKVRSLLDEGWWELNLLEGLADGHPFWQKLHQRHAERHKAMSNSLRELENTTSVSRPGARRQLRVAS